METYSFWGLRIYPGRVHSTWALVWSVQAGRRQTSRRLAWGVIRLSRTELAGLQPMDLLELAARSMARGDGHVSPGEASREPRGAVGGGSPIGQGLPGIDPDE